MFTVAESSPSLSDTHIGGEEESSGSGTVKIEPEDDSTGMILFDCKVLHI